MEDAKKYIYYIYKLCYEDEKNNLSYCYIGSTNNIKNRHRQHQQSLNNPNDKEYNTLKYETIRKYPNLFEMVVIHKTTEPITQREAHILEEQYRVNLNANLNDNRCYRTNQEYHKEYYEKQKQYRQQNKEYSKEYYEKRKQYYEENKELINQKAKLFRQASKEKRAIQRRAYYLRKKAEQLNKPQTPT